MRPTRALIDLSAIARNYRFLHYLAGGVEVLPVVKADAYGHGAVPVARRLASEGACRFAVATAEEGVALRRAGIGGEILILGYSDAKDAPLHHGYGLTPALHDLGQARDFADASRRRSAPLSVHLKFDTGMGRLGFSPGDIALLVEILRGAPGLSPRGTFTQLSCAEDTASPATGRQVAAMRSCIEALRAAGVSPGLVHVANSAGVLARPDALFDAVRPGLALYGITPSEELRCAELEPAMTLETRVLSVRRVPAGTPLGYGGAFRTRRPSLIATLPIGYHDGLRRSLSGKVSVLMEGGVAPIVGMVSMDLTLVDATDCGAVPRERVVLLGRVQNRELTAWDLARAAETIPYEIVCGVGARVPRVYT